MAAPEITPLPQAPRRSNPNGFSQTMDAFLGQMPVMAGEMNALAVWMQDAALKTQDTLTDATKGKIMRVGAFGVGAPVKLGSGGILSSEMTGFIGSTSVNSVPDDAPEPERRYAGVISNVSEHSGLVVVANGGATVHGRIKGQGQSWGNWFKFLTSATTTIDSNGFVKAASPVVRVGGEDDGTAGFVAAGAGAVNVEAAEVNVTRVQAGVYRIAGSAGLAQSGWQVETPRDINGNPLVHVATSWDGDVLTVNVCAPVWREGRVVAGDPSDVPAGRWIDVRLHKPEL